MENALSYLKNNSCRGMSAASASCLRDELKTIKNQKRSGLLLVSRQPNCFLEAIASDVKRNKKVDNILSICGEAVSEFLGNHDTAVVVVTKGSSTALRGKEVTQINIQNCLTS